MLSSCSLKRSQGCRECDFSEVTFGASCGERQRALGPQNGRSGGRSVKRGSAGSGVSPSSVSLRRPYWSGDLAPAPVSERPVGDDAERFERVDALLGDGAQVRPVIAHVEGVEQLLASVQAAEPGRAGEHGSVGWVLPLDRAADVDRVGELEEAQVRAVPARERVVDRVTQGQEGVCDRAAANTRPGRGQSVCPRPPTSSTRINSQLRIRSLCRRRVWSCGHAWRRRVAARGEVQARVKRGGRGLSTTRWTRGRARGEQTAEHRPRNIGHEYDHRNGRDGKRSR
jgi:hypothetical protein